jgi:hypothetical protein
MRDPFAFQLPQILFVFATFIDACGTWPQSEAGKKEKHYNVLTFSLFSLPSTGVWLPQSLWTIHTNCAWSHAVSTNYWRHTGVTNYSSSS